MFLLSFLFSQFLANKLQEELLGKHLLHMAFHHFITIVYTPLKANKNKNI